MLLPEVVRRFPGRCGEEQAPSTRTSKPTTATMTIVVKM